MVASLRRGRSTGRVADRFDARTAASVRAGNGRILRTGNLPSRSSSPQAIRLVVPPARGIPLFHVSLSPVAQLPQRFDHAVSHRRQSIFHVWRRLRQYATLNQAVPCHPAQRLRQYLGRHLLGRNVPDRSVQLVGAHWPRGQQMQHRDPPFIGEQFDGVPRPQGRFYRRFCHAFPVETRLPPGA